MAKAIRFHKTGGPEVLQLDDIQVGDPGEGQAKIRHTAIGLNFIDTYHRSGLYPLPLPSGVGSEAAGVVEAVGKGVTLVKPGDRVAYAGGPPGAYSEMRLYPADRLVKLPKGISDEQAAAMMLKGLTVQYLLKNTLPQAGLQAGDHVLFHAAAGGVGLIACQWAKALGLRLIGTAGSDAKCQLALDHGASDAINYRSEDFVARVKAITGGRGVKVVYDSVGAETLVRSLDCLQPFGLAANFGNASGKVPPIDLGLLAAKGSLYVSRPTLFTHIATRESTQAMAKELFAVVRSGAVKIRIDQRYPLAEVAEAHRALEARETTGCSVLLPVT